MKSTSIAPTPNFRQGEEDLRTVADTRTPSSRDAEVLVGVENSSTACLPASMQLDSANHFEDPPPPMDLGCKVKRGQMVALTE